MGRNRHSDDRFPEALSPDSPIRIMKVKAEGPLFYYPQNKM